MPAPDQYLTVTGTCRGEYREKGSRFFGFADYVGDEEEANKMRSKLKKEYHDATHQPYAYRLTDGTEKSSDDGEPRGTSGSSILTRIKKADLFNVQIVVVRYFGGTKLGKGGLARAFSECAQQTLQSTEIKKVPRTEYVSIHTLPENVNTIKSISSTYNAHIDSILYDSLVRIRFAIPASRAEPFKKVLQSRYGADIISNES